MRIPLTMKNATSPTVGVPGTTKLQESLAKLGVTTA